MELATYIHDLNPVLIEFTESLKLRWYGLAYLAGFIAGFYLLKKFGEKKLWVLPGTMAGDFIAAAAFFGVFIGGRLGHMLFYENFEWLQTDPLLPFKVWKGGMASHGGIIGLMIFTFYYSRKYKVSCTGLGDGLCVVAPLGLMFGRIANFINGELYGRITNVSWAMKFPDAFWNSHLAEDEFSRRGELYHRLLESDPEKYSSIIGRTVDGSYYLTQSGGGREKLLEIFREDESAREIAGSLLELRHPSQLYEAFFEGALLFAVLYIIRLKFPQIKHGILTGLFFVLYAFGRIFCELYREPEILKGDSKITQGQFLSFFMIAIGVGFIIWGWKKGGNAPQDRIEFDKRPKPSKAD